MDEELPSKADPVGLDKDVEPRAPHRVVELVDVVGLGSGAWGGGTSGLWAARALAWFLRITSRGAAFGSWSNRSSLSGRLGSLSSPIGNSYGYSTASSPYPGSTSISDLLELRRDVVSESTHAELDVDIASVPLDVGSESSRWATCSRPLIRKKVKPFHRPSWASSRAVGASSVQRSCRICRSQSRPVFSK